MKTSPAAIPAIPSAGAAAHRYPAERPLEGGSPRTTTLEEERREVFDSVLQSMRVPEPDAGRMAACAFLLRHLARTQQRWGA
jgi:hypothetical protein